MELPLVNESSFTPAHPASYSLEDFWPIGEHSSLRNRDESTVTDQSMSNNGGRKKRVLPVNLNPNTCSAAEQLHDSNSKKVKVLAVKEETRILQDEEDDTSFTGAKHGKQNKKLPDPSKQDYIHVRARRGQATDSHSLAERARREKISERMKILQDLVPGCNKIIGKALVLDEIINYVLSLQNQVEFLSMKLEAINSSIIPKDMMLSTKNLKASGVDSAGITFHAHPTNEYAHGPQSESLSMHLGGNLERATQ